MMIHFPKLTANLKINPNSPEKLHRLVKLCLSYAEFIQPEEFQLETGRMMQLLNQFPQGLSREELLSQFYPQYTEASPNRKISLKLCLEKIIQRSRQNFKDYNLTISYSKIQKTYHLNIVS